MSYNLSKNMCIMMFSILSKNGETVKDLRFYFIIFYGINNATIYLYVVKILI
jgi:hypothetical protein